MIVHEHEAGISTPTCPPGSQPNMLQFIHRHALHSEPVTPARQPAPQRAQHLALSTDVAGVRPEHDAMPETPRAYPHGGSQQLELQRPRREQRAAPVPSIDQVRACHGQHGAGRELPGLPRSRAEAGEQQHPHGGQKHEGGGSPRAYLEIGGDHVQHYDV
ncbi:unnamed protein product [Phytophthora fragariaefolia]|uniref:Unnamed protein product n=1 Tax=Phytophthora fragariaefolia TaxID=1490495 RepID=A0A9W6YCF3_9STRA|nr:unnamed protein product [Phytophthora fragariaefolia]